MKTQEQMYHEAVQKIFDENRAFMDMIKDKVNAMTNADLEALIKRKPEKYGRFFWVFGEIEMSKDYLTEDLEALRFALTDQCTFAKLSEQLGNFQELADEGNLKAKNFMYCFSLICILCRKVAE